MARLTPYWLMVYLSLDDNNMTYTNNIDTLLDLDGIVMEQAGGHWVKFEVRRVDAREEIPHGIRYSLTLHDSHGTRVMGFDNAHSVKKKIKGIYQGRKTYDHRHRHSKDEGVPYEFTNASQLLVDFWLEVDKILSKYEINTEEKI